MPHNEIHSSIGVISSVWTTTSKKNVNQYTMCTAHRPHIVNIVNLISTWHYTQRDKTVMPSQTMPSRVKPHIKVIRIANIYKWITLKVEASVYISNFFFSICTWFFILGEESYVLSIQTAILSTCNRYNFIYHIDFLTFWRKKIQCERKTTQSEQKAFFDTAKKNEINWFPLCLQCANFLYCRSMIGTAAAVACITQIVYLCSSTGKKLLFGCIWTNFPFVSTENA